MKLKRILVRYYSPGIILEYITSANLIKQVIIDLSNLITQPSIQQSIELLINSIIVEYNLEIVGYDQKRYNQLYGLIQKILQRYELDNKQLLSPYKLIDSYRPHHAIQLCNIACSKQCNLIATCSYDRTCKINILENATNKYNIMHTLSGHHNVVYCVALNNNTYNDHISHACDVPLSEQLLVATGSFDTTCKVYNVNTGHLVYTFNHHTKEVICCTFSTNNQYIASGSIDCTVCIYNINTGELMYRLNDHTAEVVCIEFNSTSTMLCTTSFDSTICIYDLLTGQLIHCLCGHTAEITAVHWTFNSEYIISSSIDHTIRIWNVSTGDCVHCITTHTNDILYSTINTACTHILSCDASGIVCVHHLLTGELVHHIHAHTSEINYCTFNTSSNKFITCCMDGSSSLYNTVTAELLQQLTDAPSQFNNSYSNAILYGEFNYDGDTVILQSKNSMIYTYRIVV